MHEETQNGRAEYVRRRRRLDRISLRLAAKVRYKAVCTSLSLEALIERSRGWRSTDDTI